MEIFYNNYELTKTFYKVETINRDVGSSYVPTLQKVGRSRGKKFISNTFDEKVINITFTLKGNIMQKRRTLGKILNVKKPQPLIFSDESDKIYYALPLGNVDIEENHHFARGSINFVVPDGLAHASFSKFAIASKNSNGILTFDVTNNGTVDVPISYTVRHNDQNGYLGFVSTEGVAQIGDDSEKDMGYKKSQVLINDTAKDKKLQSWTTGGGKFTDNFPTAGQWGEVNTGGRYFMQATSWGTGNSWHGASKRKTIPADSYGDSTGSANFTVETRLHFLNSVGDQNGLMELILSDSTNTKVLGFALDKGLPGNQAKIRLYNGETSAHIDIDLGHNNYVDWDTGVIRIEKMGDKVTFSFANRTVSYRPTTMKDVKFTTINLLSAQMQQRPVVARMWWEYVKFTKHYVNELTRVPNRFSKNSQVDIDGETGKIRLNNTLISDVNGSNWFLLPPGDHRVQVFYSTFSNPAPYAEMRYREAWT